MEDLKDKIEQLQQVYYIYTETVNLDSEDKTYMGYVYPEYDEKFVAFFMRWWVDLVDKQLDLVPPHSEEYAEIIGSRGVTIEELKLILSARTSPDTYFEERAFEYFFIHDKQEHDFFISRHTFDTEKDLFDSFLDVVMEAYKDEIPLLHEFFFGFKTKIYFPIESLKKHTYILGASGSGKSEIIKNMWYDLQKNSHAKNSKTLIAIEPSGKLIGELLQYHLNAEKRERVVYLDTNIRQTAKQLLGEDLFSEDYTFILNPFELGIKSHQNLNYMAQALSDAVFELMEDDKKGQMNNLIKACTDLLLEMDDTSLIDLRDINDEDTPREYLDAIPLMRNETRKRFMMTKFQTSKMETSKNGVYQRVHDIIDDQYLTNVLTGGNTVDLEKEINSGKIILFNPTSLHDKSIKAYGKLLVALISAYIVKRKDRVEKTPKQTFLFIDEAQDFITASINTIMAKNRKFGLHAVLANQVLGQDMTTATRKILMGNTAIKVAGDNEEDSIKAMAKAMGGMKVEKFNRLRKHHFYVHNRENKKAGARVFKASDKLVDVKPPYYMDKEALRAFLLWCVYESGYYIKLSDKTTKQRRKQAPKDEAFKPTWHKDE